MREKGVYRVIDANANRLREALRVTEDVARFSLDSAPLAKALKALRHEATRIIQGVRGAPCLLCAARSPAGDVGRTTSAREMIRRDSRDLLFANLQRAKESLRVLEEFFKLIDRRKSARWKALRYDLYEIEKKAARRVASVRHPRPRHRA